MSGHELDLYLSHGYFRMHQNLFTCRFLFIGDEIYSVHWLRIALHGYKPAKNQRELLKRNRRFSVAVKPMIVTREHEDLYALYKNSVDFEAPESVDYWLYSGERYTTFDTQVVEVRDGSLLIAVGIFDNGAESIAGIMNFYHPDYRKFSLGKYLMLLKAAHAQATRKAFYYPGYMVHNYPKFDYKLFLSKEKTEVFNETAAEWVPYSPETVSALSHSILFI